MVRVLGVVGAMVIGSIEGVVWGVVIIVGGVMVIVVWVVALHRRQTWVGWGVWRGQHCEGAKYGERGEV